ncbi:MAG: exodeoxyribonuclease VII large subunit [Bacteroidetes bacterium]|nr:exodeoxyribonuclease VII large subunit [Bacteroidota bacterium]
MSGNSNRNVLTVSEITGEIKKNLEESFQSINVIGEISNFKPHVSGHWYFTLKDTGAQISCTMWRGLNSQVYFTPQDGMKIVATGKISVFAPRGSYQLDVKFMQPAGQGELQAAFEKLKQKLHTEGLFDLHYKKEIPAMPQKIGIVTASDGAAFRDMINIAMRRFPLVELIIVPTRVQGSGAAESISENIARLNNETDVDVIIIGRGGGSLEDLWAFNEEIVARAVFDSKIPIISAVGHEVDFTISDFVADLRAPTPSAAMELATPDSGELFAFISDFSYTSTNNIENLLEEMNQKIGQTIKSYGFNIPFDLIKNYSQSLDNSLYKLNANINSSVKDINSQLKLLDKTIKSYDLKETLRRGFTIISQDSKVVSRSKDYDYNKKAKIKFYDDEIEIN